MTANKHVFQLLSSDGDGTGTSSAVGDYSVTPLSLKIDAVAHSDIIIERMIVMIQDSNAMDTEDYGNLATLTNGIRVYVRNSSDAIIEEITVFPILSNGHWAGHCHDFTIHGFNSGDRIASIRWTFAKSGKPIVLKAASGNYLEVLLNDDFTGLVDHKFDVQGYYEHLNLG